MTTKRVIADIRLHEAPHMEDLGKNDPASDAAVAPHQTNPDTAAK